LDFPDKTGLQSWSDLLKFKAEISVTFLRYKSVAIMVRFPPNSSHKNLEKLVGFLRQKRIAIMVRFSSNSK